MICVTAIDMLGQDFVQVQRHEMTVVLIAATPADKMTVGSADAVA